MRLLRAQHNDGVQLTHARACAGASARNFFTPRLAAGHRGRPRASWGAELIAAEPFRGRDRRWRTIPRATRICGLLAAAICISPSVAASPEAACASVVEGTIAALRGEHAKAKSAFASAKELPDPARLDAVRGLSLLLAGREVAARPLLDPAGEWALYRAMAELPGAGGVGRAQQILARRAEADDAPAGVLFLAALAFSDSKQPERATALLERAVKKAPSALDEAFAPDAAVALVRAARLAIEGHEAADVAPRLAAALLAAGRRQAALHLVEGSKTLDADRVRVAAWSEVDRRMALKEAERASARHPDDAFLALRRAELEEQNGDVAEAARLLGKDRAPGADDDVLEPRRARLLARIALAEKRNEDALDAARTAARLDPKSDEAVALLVRAMLANGEADRAASFADELLARRPLSIDPHALIAEIEAARRHDRNVPAAKLRSQAFLAEAKKVEAATRAREDILSGVRDAEAGLGARGLPALRATAPGLGLPVDLAIARSATGGAARAARDRILFTCAGKLRTFLLARAPWDRAAVSIAPYGKVIQAQAPLSAADPARCGALDLRIPRGQK